MPGRCLLGFSLNLGMQPEDGTPIGKFAYPVQFEKSVICEAYRGTSLSLEKQNVHFAKNKTIIERGGVADYILITDAIYSAQELINAIQPISDFVQQSLDDDMPFYAILRPQIWSKETADSLANCHCFCFVDYANSPVSIDWAHPLAYRTEDLLQKYSKYIC